MNKIAELTLLLVVLVLAEDRCGIADSRTPAKRPAEDQNRNRPGPRYVDYDDHISTSGPDGP